METIAFYSYTGDLLRPLLLLDAAHLLAAGGSRVIVLDLNFEAPALHYWISGEGRDAGGPALRGVIPYLIATAQGAAYPPPMEEHLMDARKPPPGWLRLMPAGPAPDRRYWAALKELGERLRLDDSSGRGVMAVLDLQARVEDELGADYLLLDTSPGITQFGGLATGVLADTVVCMFLPDQASVDGTVAIAESLKAAPRLESRDPLRIVPVLLRRSFRVDEPRFSSGVARLLELGEAQEEHGGRATPFELPEPVVGSGDTLRAALQLFRHVFRRSAGYLEQRLEALDAG